MVGRLCRSLSLALVVVFAMISTATGLELVVVAASSSSNVSEVLAPDPGVPCADALKALKAAAFRITDVQGGFALTYTLERLSLLGNPAVVIVICAPEETPPPPTS